MSYSVDMFPSPASLRARPVITLTPGSFPPVDLHRPPPASNPATLEHLSEDEILALFQDYLDANQDRILPDMSYESGLLAPTTVSDYLSSATATPSITPLTLTPDSPLPSLFDSQIQVLTELAATGNIELASSIATTILSPKATPSRPRTRSRRSKHDLTPPRPLNSFMTYRFQRQHDVLRLFPNIDNRDISRVVAAWWNAETEVIKNEWRQRAEEGKRLHAERYPDYRYRPRRKDGVVADDDEAFETSPFAGPIRGGSGQSTPRRRRTASTPLARLATPSSMTPRRCAATLASIEHPTPLLTHHDNPFHILSGPPQQQWLTADMGDGFSMLPPPVDDSLNTWTEAAARMSGLRQDIFLTTTVGDDAEHDSWLEC